jgi:hypothetical protein
MVLLQWAWAVRAQLFNFQIKVKETSGKQACDASGDSETKPTKLGSHQH